MATKPRKPAGRGGNGGKPKKFFLNRPNPFITLVENTVDAYTAYGDGAVNDVRRILADLRRQYDEVHAECEKREKEVMGRREAMRQAESAHNVRSEDMSKQKQEELRASLQKQVGEKEEQIQESLTNRKVYMHMFERLKKERAILKQKLVQMESHLQRKTHEFKEKLAETRLCRQQETQTATELELTEHELDCEKQITDNALSIMDQALASKKGVIRRRGDFDRWRKEVAMEAANEAFNASAGRLKKLWAIEKLGGNCLQEIILEQVETSQATEDGFQKIREVTGLTDVMDIVHKFLNRDVEHEQLKAAVKEAESKLEQLREEAEHLKRETEGQTFDGQSALARKIYLEVEDAENNLNKSRQEHATSKERLHRTTMMFDHMKAWAKRVNRSFAGGGFEDASALDSNEVVKDYLVNLRNTVDRFMTHITTQLRGKPQKSAASQHLSREHHERMRVLNDKDFLRTNCRIPPPQERPTSAGKGPSDDFDNPYALMQAEREKYKADATTRVNDALRKSTKAQKKPKQGAKND